MTNRVVVAMSGGVDSSVAALLLHRSGYDVAGVSMQVWDYRNHGGSAKRATCCAPDDFTDARRVAAKIGVPYYVVDFERHFREEVIERFIATYEAGLTPNPCVDCNNRVKFKELRNRALMFGCDAVATGHYARIEQSADGYHLLRGADPDKDQSYFLYGLSQSELSNTIFPVGEMTKPQVRALAREFDLVTAEKAESQDICFVSGSVSEFLTRIGRKRSTPGEIRTAGGEVLGRHDGATAFTVGQRRGLRMGGVERPLYVLEIRPDEHAVIVGERSELERDSFGVRELSWVAPSILASLSSATGSITFEALAQLRHRHPGVPVTVKLDGEGDARVSFRDGWTTVSPGQAAVFYDLSNREVLGGGRIAPERPDMSDAGRLRRRAA